MAATSQTMAAAWKPGAASAASSNASSNVSTKETGRPDRQRQREVEALRPPALSAG